jgi:hypothetical protein
MHTAAAEETTATTIETTSRKNGSKLVWSFERCNCSAKHTHYYLHVNGETAGGPYMSTGEAIEDIDHNITIGNIPAEKRAEFVAMFNASGLPEKETESEGSPLGSIESLADLFGALLGGTGVSVVSVPVIPEGPFTFSFVEEEGATVAYLVDNDGKKLTRTLRKRENARRAVEEGLSVDMITEDQSKELLAQVEASQLPE